MPIDVLSVLYPQLTRDLLAIAKLLSLIKTTFKKECFEKCIKSFVVYKFTRQFTVYKQQA